MGDDAVCMRISVGCCHNVDVRFLPIYNPEVTRAYRSRRCHKYATLCLEILYQVRRLVIDQQGITVSRLKSISLGGEAVSERRRMICGP
jgi:hypothetical protein